ncbi:putative response regulator receiver protein [Selenomonas ruminantium subsp. lactilytica TAM6421]|uniref:Putative response regulator receiver protein n=2 Tax=Selenomonas ruminantium TaxID=971 RepID=I0GUA9_SELRL|nr:putative response regulator receiver protein [Selenomonas ruminantium subsp. lactilytica TAM6421]
MLIVDDVEINRVVLTQFFQEDYAIIEAENGQEALQALTEHNVSIVLVDLVMPIMDGFQVLAFMKQDDQYMGIPVVVMTANNDGDSEARAMEMGAADFITKPYNPTIVRCRIRNVMAREENEWRRAAQVAQNRQLAEMHQFAERDPLTGIFNREAFYRRASERMQAHYQTPYSIVYMDISCFKVVNDLFRIETGNLVLKTAAYYLDVLAGEDGICARIEADHFALCMPTDKLDMDTVIAGLDSTIQSLGISHNVLFYAGVYPVENAFLPVDQMCDRAHMALNRVKGKYMPRYAFYDKAMRDQMIEEQMIVRNMEYALQERQFVIKLQPVYGLQEKQVIGAEALVRWNYPKGMIMPGKFIPIFEKNGFIVRLDRYVWEEACKVLRSQLDEGVEPVPISVNVSRLNFFSHDLLEFLQGLVKKYDLQPNLLKLEITESAYVENPHQLMAMVRAFRGNGFPVMMDDFGSGFSSLSMLKDLPVDVLKIDMAFVQEVDKSSRAGAIMETVVELGQRLHMNVVVEGVETKEQLDFLERIGCREVQGYYFAKPMDVESFKGLVKRSRNIAE